MEIDEALEKWFKDTASAINVANSPNKPKYNLCAGILPLARNYSNAVTTLLNNGFRLPAMALIRILAELTLRTVWCFFPNSQDENDDVRIERWLKESYRQRKRCLEKYLISANEKDLDSIEAEVKFLEDKIKKIPYKFAGDIYGSLESLLTMYSGDEGKELSWKDDLYPILYTNFNQSIHLDLVVLLRLINLNGNKYTFFGDYRDMDINTLKIYCMSCVFNIIAVTRSIYGLDYEDVKQEYLKVKKENRK